MNQRSAAWHKRAAGGVIGWFHLETAPLTKVLMEMGPDHPLGRACVDYLARIRRHGQILAEDAGLERCGEFARAWHLLLKGSIISAMEGDPGAAELARQMAMALIERHRQGAV